MTEIKLTKRYPQSRTEDIVDAYMRGWNDALDAVQNGKFIINADRKTENSSEKPNNCETCRNKGVEGCEQPCLGCGCCGLYEPKAEPSNSEIPNNCEVKNYCDDCLYTDTCDSKEFFYACTSKATISKMEQVDKDINVRSKDCETCKHYKLACELFSEICKYEPTTQTETQNSNLTFKTLEYCDICDHKGCEECIANALDEHCMPSQFKKQIEDECAKEYEELGLKELKELIKADRKTENSSEKPNNSKVSEKPTGSERSSE